MLGRTRVEEKYGAHGSQQPTGAVVNLGEKQESRKESVITSIDLHDMKRQQGERSTNCP